MYGIPEERHPTTADVGKFIPNAELLEWHASLVKKNIFPKDDNPFGPYKTQHAEGIKMIAYFRGDVVPKKPQRCEIKGSKWRSSFTGKKPLYVVSNDDGKLTQIPWMLAHAEEEAYFKYLSKL